MLPQLHVAIYILVHSCSNGQSVQPKFMPTATEVSFIVMTQSAQATVFMSSWSGYYI